MGAFCVPYTNNNSHTPANQLAVYHFCEECVEILFHLDFGSEILEQVRYERLPLYSLEHLRLADTAIGRIRGE